MSRVAASSLAARLTAPFAPGADAALLTLNGSGTTSATIKPYDDRLALHQALYGSLPDRFLYVLIARRDVDDDTSLTVDYNPSGTSPSVNVPAGTPAGSAFAILRDGGPMLRLTQLNVKTGPEANPPAVVDGWALFVLLGNMARLLWVVGVESDLIRRQLEQVRFQRHLTGAAAAGPITSTQDVILMAGDDYNDFENPALRWNDSAGRWPNLTGASLALVIAGAPQSFAPTCPNPGAPQQFLQLQLLAARTSSLPSGSYAIQATVQGGPIVTLITGRWQMVTYEAGRDALDWIGADLGVPRFPPRAYTYQDSTLALYHLDSGSGPDGNTFADAMKLYGGTGHDAVNAGGLAVPAPGRFSNGLAFRNPAAILQVADHPDFALPANRSFTVECFVKPDVPSTATPPATEIWHVVSKHPDPTANPSLAGWALSVGRFHKFPVNARFLLADGSASGPVQLFADVDLAGDGLFHHLAGVVDRQAASGQSHARLYVDGQLATVQALTSLGALTSSAPLRLGAGSAPSARGIVDEVRLSSAARASFAPVLGEDDVSYRRRLALFQRWTLPTSAELQRILNQAVGPLALDPNADPEPLVVNDQNVSLVPGSRVLSLGPPDSPAPPPARPSLRVGALTAAISGSNVALSGIATAGQVNFTILVEDGAGATAWGNYSLRVNGPLALGSLTPAQAPASQSYSGSIAISNGTAPFTLQASSGLGALAAAISGSNIAITGIAPASNVTFTVSVKDSAGAVVTAGYTLTIQAGVTLAALAPAQTTAGQSYSGTIPIVNGTGPYTLRGSSGLGALVAAISASNVTITGTSPGGNVAFSVTVQDNTGATATGNYLLTVNAAPTLGFLSPTPAAPSQNYSGTIAILNGTGPFTLQASSGLGSLAAAVSANNVAISGTAPATNIDFSVTVKDGANATASGNFTLAMRTGLILGALTPGQTTAGQSYTGTIPVRNGTAPLALQSSNFPSGGTVPPLPGFDVNVGQIIQLSVDGLNGQFYLQQQANSQQGDRWVPVATPPASGSYMTVPAGTVFQYKWILILIGAGRADPGDGNGSSPLNQKLLQLTAIAPGELIVKVELSWPVSGDLVRRTRTFELQTALRIGIDQLAAGAATPLWQAADGTPGVTDAVAGEPNALENSLARAGALPYYLLTVNDSRAAYTALNSRRMQAAMAAALGRLLNLVAPAALATQLQVVSAFDPTLQNPPTPENVGRGLTLSHPKLDASRLAALALAAGFTFARVPASGIGAPIVVRQQADDLVTITDPGPVAVGASATLTVSPRSGPQAAYFAGGQLYVANALSDSVSVIQPIANSDPGSSRVLGAFKVGWAPQAVAVRPESGLPLKRLFTADNGGGTVTSVDLQGAAAPQQLAAAAGPVALAVTPAWVFVACRDANLLTRLDAADVPVAPRVDVSVSQPSAVAVTPDGAQVWVAVPPDNTVRVYSSTPAAVTLIPPPIPLGDTPSALVMAPDGKRAYVSLPGTGRTGRIAVLDVAGKRVDRTIDVPPSPNPKAQPGALAVVDRGAAGLTLAAADTGLANPLLHLFDAAATGFALRHRASLALGGAAAGLATGTVANNTVPWLFAVLPDGDRIAVIDPVQATLLYVWGLGTGRGESLAWAVQPPGAASLSSTTAPQIVLTAQAKVRTRALVQAAYTLPPGPGRGVAPYTFEVRVKDSLQKLPVSVVIRKEQYDLIMNILNAFHPIGVEVLTGNIRRHVLEVKAGLLEVLPEYTFPNFRLRGRPPRRPSQE
jgi:DNA-binding beta-propeller fold protein YncE